MFLKIPIMTAHSETAVQPPAVRPSPLRFIMPSVTDIIFTVVFFTLAFGSLSPRLLGDGDTGWHIVNGERILATHSIPLTDSFSYTLPGHRWYAWEWLYDVAVGELHQRAGMNGVVLLSAFLIALTFALLFRWTLAGTGHVLSVALLLLLCLMASSIHFLARPHIVSWLLVLVFWKVLDDYVSGNQTAGWRVLLLPALMLLWVNVHGGFLLGIVLCGIYLAGEAGRALFGPDSRERTRSRARARWLAVSCLLLLGATFVNPYGWSLWTHIHGYLSNRYFMDHIQEFLSPNFHGAAEKSFAALVLLAIAALALKRRPIALSRLLIILLAVYSGLYAARNIPFAAMLLMLSLAPVLTEIVAGAAGAVPAVPASRFFARLDAFSEHMGSMDLRLRGHALSCLVTMLGLWIGGHQGHLGARQVMTAEFSPAKFPAGAVNYLGSRGVRQQVFSPDYWGGYLIYRLYPRFRVYMDDRHDFFGEQFVKDYVKVRDVEPGWQNVLANWRVNYVLIKPASALANTLEEMPDWRDAYHDEVSVVFAREHPIP
jgi:hypothetical protein